MKHSKLLRYVNRNDDRSGNQFPLLIFRKTRSSSPIAAS